ncbi:hypothetical protein GTY62_00115 [Streptomyces sp. SID724]|uniref:hypothetical protein n=1 Tax=Streptomyces sp. SID724 TaxID=2690324 RepID=UPI00136124B7|nr:hypothetical protein [Streptomyces sp. SID724]
MGERFTTPDQVLSHWRLDAADPYRVSETKTESEDRRDRARSRGERASDAELIGSYLLVARLQQSRVTGEHLWGVFHVGTSLPVTMLKAGQGADAARTLAEALDTWRDPETGEPFDWASGGLSDRLRSSYGRGLLDHAHGRGPGERWAGTAPADAEVHETDDGQEYQYVQDGSSLTVYAPGGLLIARAVSRFDVKTRKDAWIGETRDGRRLPGRWASDFVENTVQQHLIAQREPSDRDSLWIHYNGDRAMVHGVDSHDTDLKKLLRRSGFTSSGHAKAYVTAGTTRPVARAQSVDRLARALYKQGRAVEIRADENRLRGVLAPAAPAPARAAVLVPAGAAEAAPAADALALSPQDLTDDGLAAELERLNEERRGAVYGSARRHRLDEQIAPLQQEREKREVAQVEDRPAPAGMEDGEIAAEREALAPTVRRGPYGHEDRTPLGVARRERDELLRVEQAGRTAAELESRPPVVQLTDEDLQAEGAQLVKSRHQRPPEAADAFGGRVAAVGAEIADRRLHAWGEQRPAEGLDDVELTEAFEALRGLHLSDTEFAGSVQAKDRVEEVLKARRHVLHEEVKQRDAKAFTALLETDGRIRLETNSRNSTTRIRIDNRYYGEITDKYAGWQAHLWRDRDITREEAWRTDALRWLIGEYEKDPETRDTRTWGTYVAVEVPPSFVDQLTTHFSDLTLSGEAEKYLIGQVADSSRSQSWDETGKKIMVHALDVPKRTLPVLEQMGRSLVDRLDEDLDSDDKKTRDRAKRARPHVLRALDDLVALMGTLGLETLGPDNASAESPQDGEADSERVRNEGPSALGDVPAAGAVADGGPGGVLPGSGDGRAGTDRGADRGEDGRSDAGDGPPAAGGQAEGGSADGPGAGAEGDRVPGAGGGPPGRGAAPVVFRPASQEDLAPAGEPAKAAANLEAVRVLKPVREEKRPASADEQQALARWSGWGSVPEIFAARPLADAPVFGPGGEREGGYAAAAARWESFADVRDPLRVLLDDDEWRAAAASTLSAHYTPPEITSALWQALTDLGFDGGEVLEPGSGSGVTFGTAPESARLTGVEIEPTSAAISRLLAPGVTVLNESFADTVAPDGSFDGVVGNVPFARVSLYDPRHNRGRHRLHNHFLIKSVALTRPGGVVALITSRHTLDAESATARKELSEMADLLGAVRLPNKAFARSAGTDVVTDILVLRRRMDGEEPLDRSWLTSSKRAVGEHQLPVNDYFAAHPEHVLGTLTSRMGAHGPEVAVDGDPDVGEALRTALRQVTDSAVLARRWYAPHPEGPHRPPLRLKPAADLQDFTGRLSADAEGKLWQTSGDGELVAVELPADQHAQLAALIDLKDLVRGLNELDRSGSDLALADAHRRLTRETYERYVAAHGALSRPGQRQNVTTQTSEGESLAGLTAWGYFLNDPQAYEVLALEMWEAGSETVHVSEILDHAPAARRSVLGQHTDDAQQALDAVVAERGHVDLAHIAWMLQVDEDEARRRLARSVFTDPLTGELLYSADYLSGDVRTKLEIARKAALRDPAFQVNAAELERVQPREMLPGQFAVRLGAAWLPDDLVQEFFRNHLGDAHLTIQHSGNGNWHILKGRGLSEEDEIKHSAGGLSPLALLSRVLSGGSMTGRPSDDEEAARAVRVKAEEWRDAFEAWVLDDSVRAARAADVYNRQMNNRVVRDFTGSRPSLAGLDPDFDPYDHQLAAAARMAHERCLVLSHVVGAGKTGALTLGMMAMKNTGQINKPMVAVPNYLVEQWEEEVHRLFPAARILTLTSADLADGKRDRMFQYVRANSFDLIIMSHSLFDSIPLSPEFYAFYNDEELRKLDAQILHERRREGKSISLKQLQERRQQHEESLKEKAAAVRTPGQVYIDDLGLDFFAVDEAHEYKNLAVRSKIPGARVAGSAKAQHLHAVLEWARRNKPTGPMGCLATGTPLSNAIGELHTLLLLANPDLLRALGIEEFDAFATMYGKMVERLEMTVDGKGFKSVERFASFHSVNSLLRQLWLPVVDYKDEEDLGLPLPSIKGGEPELMLVPATTEQQALMEELGERYEAYHLGEVDKSEDNPLSINTDARVIALDPRLIDAQAEPGNKLRMLADRIAAKYHETKNDQYTYSTKDLRPHPVPGALQMVFLNQGTPGGKNRGNFNAYQELKDLLVERDVPAEKIDFIHDASRADQRRKLTARANHGGSNVLIGSTQRMGKGLNAQNRAVALYHVDPDFRPADMKQKDGRALRQGNQNKVVEIVWVATENTFDSRMYGILATKAKGFDQLYKARLDAGSDEIQEVDEAIVPFEEAMAIISGNPYLIAQEDLRKKLRTLTLDQNNRATQRAIVFKKVQQLNKDIDTLTRDIKRRGIVLPLLPPVLGDDFEITLGGVTYTKHKDAAVPLTDALAGVLEALPEERAFSPDTVLGRLGGRDLVAVAFRQDGQEVPFVRVHLDGLPGSLNRFDAVELSILKGETLLRRLTKTITEAPQRQTEDEGNLTAKQATRDELLVYSEQLRGQVPGLGRARERLSLVDGLVAAQIAVNKAGKPAKDESAAETEKRKQAIERRDGLQQQLDRFDDTPSSEASTEAGEALLDLDEMRPRDPGLLSPQQVESEAAILRAHIAVHGDPDGTAAARLAELQTSLVAASLDQWMDGLVNPAPNKGVDGQRPASAPRAEGKPESTETGAAGPGDALQGLIDGFGDRVMVGHIGGQQPAPEPPGESDGQPTEQPGEQPEGPAETVPAPPADEVLADEEDDAPAPDGDGYGTADLFEAFGLTQQDRVPVSEAEQETPSETPDGVSDGQMTVEEVQSEAAPEGPGDVASRGDGRVRLTSADGRLTFTLLEVPADAGLAPQAVDGYQRRLSEFTAVVETKNEQAAQTPAEQAEQLTRWRRTFKGDNRLEPFRPLPSLRLTPRVDAPGLIPAEYDTGSWVTWRDGQSGQQVTGQVMGPGPATNSWFVSTDRSGHTGEYHVLSRSGKKSSGYTYSLNGAATDLRPVDGPGQQLPLEDLPTVDAVPSRPVASYADWLPPDTHRGRALARVREPIEVTVGQMGPRFDRGEVAFDVVADGIPFVVKSDQNDETLTMRFVPRVESEGTVVAEFDPRDSRAEAVDFCVQVAREARELADKPLWAQGRNYAFELAGEGVCGRCSLHLDDSDVKPLYRVDGGDADCASHLFLRFRAEEEDVASLARARRIWAVRQAPDVGTGWTMAPADAEQPMEALTEPETAAAVVSQDPRPVARNTLQGGNRVTVVVSSKSIEGYGDIWGDRVPETATVTGTVYPGYRDYHQNTTLLDALIVDPTGGTAAAPDGIIFIRHLPAQVQLIPAEHRDDLRPETRTVAHIRLGDLIAEGGTRGETITELRFGNDRRGSVMEFSTRDVAKDTPNGFALAFTGEVLVVPRERRAPQDVTVVFGRHSSHHQIALETQQTYDLHAAVTEVTSRVWPDGTGPQEQIRALSEAIGAIDTAAKTVDAYRANAAAMEAADAAAAALFASTDNDTLNGYVGLPLHRLRQHLDFQAQRLRNTAVHLDEHAATSTETVTTPPVERAPEDNGYGTAEPEPSPATVHRATLTPGNLVTVTLDVPGVVDSLDREVTGPVTVTGHLYPGFLPELGRTRYAILLDSLIRDSEGTEVADRADVTVQDLPARVLLMPAGHRDDLRPQTRGVTEVRVGDLVAEGGARGEEVTRVAYAVNPRGATTFYTRDVATGTANVFTRPHRGGISVVPRERRLPQDVAALFGEHTNRDQVLAETRAVLEGHTALAEAAALQWPDGDGPQTELRNLHDAIGRIDRFPNGADDYRANARAMTRAESAAGRLFAQSPNEARYQGHIGGPLHALRQRLDIQVHKLSTLATRLEERAEQRSMQTPPAPAPDGPTPETPTPERPAQEPASPPEPKVAAAEETEQLGLFGDPAQNPAKPKRAAGGAAAPAGERGPEAQLRAALAQGETIVPVSFTDGREPAAGWILTTAGGHTFRLRPVPHSLREEDKWEAGHDANGSYWWAMNLEDRPLGAVLARVRKDSATRARFAELWARYGHLTEQAPEFGTTTDRVQLEEGVYLVSRFGRIGLIASCRWGWEHLTDPDGAEGHTGEDWSRKGPDHRQYVAEWQVWNRAQDAIANARLRVVARLTDDMADTPDAYCDASEPYVGKCSAKRSGSRYTVAVDTEQGSEIGCYTVCARCLSHRLLTDQERQINHRGVRSLVETLAKGDPKVSALYWKQWPDRAAELAGQMLSAALDAGETAPWPARALAGQLLAEACEAGDDRAMREARAEVKAAGGNAGAQKRAADEALAARQDRTALVARADGAATAILGLAGWETPEASSVTPEPAEETAPEAIDINTLTVNPQVRDGEPSFYQFTVTGPGLTVGKYKISHDAQGKGAQGIMWRATWHGVEPSGRWDVISIGSGEGRSAALAAVAEHAAKTGGDLAAGFTVARRMHYDAGLWLLPDVGESEAIQYHPDGSWTITAETGAPYTVRREWRGRAATNDLAPLLIEDQAGTLIASCTAVDSYMTAWEPMLERLRLHATAVANGESHATAVTLGGPNQDWVEAWCVCGWTERADVDTYADRAPAGEALALAHHEEVSAADGTAAAAELPELDVVLLDVEVPPLAPAEPYESDEEAQADIDRLDRAFARWEALPTVQRYHEADRHQRSDGTGDPTNAVAQLTAAYRDAALSLRDGPARSPEDLVRQVHTVSVWSGALESVVDENLRGPLREVREAATLLASRSQATVEAFEAELAALSTNPEQENPAPEQVPATGAATRPAPARPSPGTEEPDPATEPAAPAAAQQNTSVPARETSREPGQEDPVTDEPQPPEAAADDAGPDVEDPPAPRSYTEVLPLPADAAYRLHLTGLDGQPPTEGELRFGETTIAAVRMSAHGRWFARLTAEGLPADLTMLNNSPHAAAEQGAVLFAALTGSPYSTPPGPAVDAGTLTRVDVIRGELQGTAREHLQNITATIARLNPDYTQIPQFQVLSVRLGDLAAAESGAHDSRQMSDNLDAVQQAARDWGSALPEDPALDERRHLAYPLAHLIHDTIRLRARLLATLEAAQRERTAAAAPVQPGRAETAQQAPSSAEPVRGPVVVLRLREDGGGRLVAEVSTATVTQSLVVPGMTPADLPGMSLPVRVGVPMLVRPAQRSEHLVSDDETRQWLAEHLVDGPLAQAWSTDTVRTVLVAGARDALLDGMAPTVEEIAEWLMTTAAEQDGLLQAAHAAESVQQFAPAFGRTADDLVADGGSEFLVWRYLGDGQGSRRLDVLDLATQGAYEQLRALPAPVPVPAPGAELAAPVAETPETSTMATPAQDDVPPVKQAAGEAPQPARPVASIQLRQGAGGRVLARVTTPSSTRSRPIGPGPFRRDGLPQLALPVTAEVPLPSRTDPRADNLVQRDETEQWLSEHLKGGPMESALQVREVKAGLGNLLRDVLLADMAPSAGEIAAWLAGALAENEDLLHAAHKVALEDFTRQQGFALAADALVASNESAVLRWAYSRRSEGGRSEVLSLAAPDAYERLRARGLPKPATAEPLPPRKAAEAEESAQGQRGEGRPARSGGGALDGGRALDADSRYRLRLPAVAGAGPREGELMYGDAAVAAVRQAVDGRWFARLAVDGRPADVTSLTGSPQDAAERGAILFAVTTGESFGGRPVAADARGGLSRADVLRRELSTAADWHRRVITGAAALLSRDYAYNPKFAVLDDRLGTLLAANVDNHGSWQMADTLEAIKQAAIAWGGALPQDPAVRERQLLAFPLMNLLHDATRMQERLQATLDAEQADRAAVQEQQEAAAAPAESARDDSTQQTPAPGPAPTVEPPTVSGAPSPGPTAEGPSADQPAPLRDVPKNHETATPSSPATPGAEQPPRGVPETEGTAVTDPDPGSGDLLPEESGQRVSADPDQLAEQTAAQDRPAGWTDWDGEDWDLPLHAEDTTDDWSARYAWTPDLASEFDVVKTAWDEHIPADKGTSEELFADVQTHLAKLQQMLADAVTKTEPGPEESAPVADAASGAGEQDEAGQKREPKEKADAVNAALHQADEHAPDLQALPEWQHLQTVRGAFGNLMNVLKKRAGEHFGKLMKDAGVSDFFRRVSLRVCEKAASWAQAGAERLRVDDERRTGRRDGSLPSAQALLRLGDAALVYCTPRDGNSTPPPAPREAPDVVGIPALHKMGEALSRPVPGAPLRASATAARGRSTTTARRLAKGTAKPAKGSVEQAGHLRRSGEQQAAAAKTNRLR